MLQFELKFKLRAADFFNCYPVLMCRLGTNGLNKANSVTGFPLFFLCIPEYILRNTYTVAEHIYSRVQ